LATAFSNEALMTESDRAKPTTPTVVGRPRRFDNDTERRLLIDAAIRVLERNGYTDMSVDDVLEEAGLSTRAFYRHFDSKESLLETFLLREAESVARSLARVVAAAPDAPSAVEAWLERFLDVFYEPRRARRATLLASAAARASGPSAEMLNRLRRIVCEPLAEVLRAGHAAGTLYSPRPEADAYSIHALVVASNEAEGAVPPDRAVTRDHVLRYAWPGLRLTV
jgi:AcrR family transcriptional regulator